MKKNQNGQAIFEFIIFLPFMLMIYTLTVTVVNSINGAINQQKSLRGFFYGIIKHNSNLPSQRNLIGFDGVQTAGMVSVGWKESLDGADQPIAACWELKSFFASNAPDTCLEGTAGSTTTQFIRPKTVYGICGATYNIVAGFFPRSSQSGSLFSCNLSAQNIGFAPEP